MSEEGSSDLSEENIESVTSSSDETLPSSRLPSTPSSSSEGDAHSLKSHVDETPGITPNQRSVTKQRSDTPQDPPPGAINAIHRDRPAVTSIVCEQYIFRPIKAARTNQELEEETLSKGLSLLIQSKINKSYNKGHKDHKEHKELKEKQVKFAKQPQVHLCNESSSDEKDINKSQATRHQRFKGRFQGKFKQRHGASQRGPKPRGAPLSPSIDTSSSSSLASEEEDLPALLPVRTTEMSGGAPWQLEGFNNQPPTNQMQFYNPNQFPATGSKAGAQDNTATGAESGHYAGWQQNYQNGYYGQQPQQHEQAQQQAGYYGQQDVNQHQQQQQQQQQWNQDGSYIQTSQPGGAPVSGGEAMYAGYGNVGQAQVDGAQGGVVHPGWNHVDPMQYWDNSYDYQNPQNYPVQNQQGYGDPSTMSSQPIAFDQSSSFSHDTDADAEVQSYTSGLGTQAGAAQLPQQSQVQPAPMEDISLDDHQAAAGQEVAPSSGQGVSLTSAASFPSLGDEADPFATLNPGNQAPVPTWPQNPPVSQPQRLLNTQADKLAHSRQSSAGGNVQFVLGGSEAGSTDNSHSNSPAPFAKVNAVQGIVEENQHHQMMPPQNQQHQQQQDHQQQQYQQHQYQQQQQQHGDSWNANVNTSSNSSGFAGAGYAGAAEMQHQSAPHQLTQQIPPEGASGQNAAAADAADDGWGWGEDEDNDVDELLRQHDQQASGANEMTVSAASAANPVEIQAQNELQPLQPDQVVPQVPADGSSRQEASLEAAVAADEAWPEMVDSGLNAGEVPNVGQHNMNIGQHDMNIGQAHQEDSSQVNPGPPVYQRSPSQASVHSTHSQHSAAGNDIPKKKKVPTATLR